MNIRILFINYTDKFISVQFYLDMEPVNHKMIFLCVYWPLLLLYFEFEMKGDHVILVWWVLLMVVIDMCRNLCAINAGMFWYNFGRSDIFILLKI